MYPLIRRYLRRVDVVYLLLCAACSAISVVVLLSIGQTQLGSNNKASVQLIASLLGLMLAVVFNILCEGTVYGNSIARKPWHDTIGIGLGALSNFGLCALLVPAFGLTGAALALVNFLRIIIFTNTSMMIAAVVSVTLFCTVIIAMIVGCLLPIGAKKLGFDPAVMASPMITTIVDACSLMIYFLIASTMLGL